MSEIISCPVFNKKGNLPVAHFKKYLQFFSAAFSKVMLFLSRNNFLFIFFPCERFACLQISQVCCIVVSFPFKGILPVACFQPFEKVNQIVDEIPSHFFGLYFVNTFIIHDFGSKQFVLAACKNNPE